MHLGRDSSVIKVSRPCYYVSPLAVQGTEPMEISVSPLTYQARKRLTCRWRLVAGSRGNIVVDMAGVDFIASIGIRHLVMAAKTVARKSGMLVLLDPNPTVTEVLFTSGLQDLLPIVRSEDEARAMLARKTAT